MTNTPGDPEASWVPPDHESLGGPASDAPAGGSAAPTQETPVGGTGAAVAGSAQAEDGPRTREDLRPPAISAAPASS
ncbi:hypothetical protein, partial [Actinoallomurus acaciae]